MTVEFRDPMAPTAAATLAAMLDLECPELTDGLPLLWHLVYFAPVVRTSDLGPDGHPQRGVLPVAPAPGVRRMFAGASVEVSGPLFVGQPAIRTSTVLSTEVKQGRSAEMTFVHVEHTMSQHGRALIRELQDIVYLPGDNRPPAAAAPSPEASSFLGAEFVVDPVVLFRFSALTHNTHRIHYDLAYAKDEGYDGLVVHGPLQGLLMARAASELAGLGPGESCRFDYRLIAPLLVQQGLHVAAAPADDGGWSAEVTDRTGRRTATSTLTRLTC